MINLDSEAEIKKVDKGNILGSIRKLPDQVEQAWEEIDKLDVPKACYLAKNVVVCGMGGSALGGRVVDSLVPLRVRTPIEVFTEYHVPNYVNKESLVIVNSYSGNTEETISAAHEAKSKGAQIFGIATGGKLAEFLKKEELPGYIYDPKENPSGQPRMALGYSITAVLAFLAKCNFFTVTKDEIEQVIESLRGFIAEYDVGVKESSNLSKRMAKKIKGKVPILVSSEHLVGASHAFKNQLNENAKTFSAIFDIPELNHHLMEGLKNPAQAKEYLYFLFFESKLYSPKVQRRYSLTREVVEKNDVETGIYQLRSSRKLEQIFELLSFGSYVSFYLAMLYGIDPGPIPWVDYFKEKLAHSTNYKRSRKKG